MKCGGCGVRPGLREYHVTRSRGLVDIYHLCMRCHSEATGIPVARAPVLEGPPCVCCGDRGGKTAGLCACCLDQLRAAVRYYTGGGTVGLESVGGRAALTVMVEETRRWTTHQRLLDLRAALVGRVAAK